MSFKFFISCTVKCKIFSKLSYLQMQTVEMRTFFISCSRLLPLPPAPRKPSRAPFLINVGHTCSYLEVMMYI